MKSRSGSLKIIENGIKSLGTVSYLHFVATMAVSLDVCEIFSVKEWPELASELAVVQDH